MDDTDFGQIGRDQPGADQDLAKRVLAKLELVKPHHVAWRRKALHYYSLYRSYQDWRSDLSAASPRGRDEVVREGKNQFGADLFIPWSFSAVEDIIPQMLASRPKMTVQPRSEDSEANVDDVQILLDAQQSKIDYELICQAIAKTGLIYGIGIQKCRWRKDFKVQRRLVPSMGPAQPGAPAPGLAVAQTLEATFDDPTAESIDPMDWFADPFAGEISEAGFAIHRTWRSTAYVRRMADTRQWRNVPDTDDKLRRMAEDQKYDEVWKERRQAQGLRSTGNQQSSKDLHEVLEFHDGEVVITVLDRKVCVQNGPNPFWHGELPFQIFRPYHDPNRLYGIGVIEPMEQLQEEINTLRSQRRDNAALVLQRVFAFAKGMIDEDALQFGAGKAIPTHGDPRELLFPIPTGDIPYSGYQEETNLMNDVQRTTGLADTSGNQPVAQTATGAQLVQAAMSRRISNQLLRFELEVVKGGTRQFLELDQQMILQPRTVRVAVPPPADAPERRWSWRKMGPRELAGEFDIEPSGGESAADNVPQDRNDGQMLWTMFGGHGEIVEQQKLAEKVLEKYGIKHAKEMIVMPAPTVPAEIMDVLSQPPFSIPVDALRAALKQAGGPDLGGAEPAPEGAQAPPEPASQNGASSQAPAAQGG